MSDPRKSYELRFSAPAELDLDNPKFTRILEALEKLGVQPLFEVEEKVLTHADLAARTPVETPESFMGFEHFKVYAGDMSNQRVARMFSGLIDPYKRPMWVAQHEQRNRTVKQLYKELDIKIAKRPRVELPPLPKSLRHHNHLLNDFAIQAGSVIRIAENVDRYRQARFGVGEGIALGIVTVANEVQMNFVKDIESDETTYGDITTP